MDGAITLEAALAVGGFLISLAVFAFGVWKYVDGKVEQAKSDAMLAVKALELKADTTKSDLAAYKTHAAETFATKAGLAESLNRVHDALDRLTDRIDALISAQAKPSSRRSSGQ